MFNQQLVVRWGARIWLGLSLALAALGLSTPSAPAVLAAPAAAPQSGGAFTVTSAADNNTNDSVLTLREALLVVRGGTGPAGLNRPATAGEQAALAGCTFSAGNITTGCGVGFANSISFNGSLGLHPVITLTASLPAITNTAPTTIDGSVNGVFPIVSAASILTNTDALLIGSDHNTLAGLTIRAAPRDDLHLTGSHNQVLTGTVLLAASRYGLLVDGGISNTISSVLVGIPSSAVGACSQGNHQGGIVLDNSAVSNTLQFATVACNIGVGVRFDGLGTTFNFITASSVTTQTGNGIEIENGASSNQILGDAVIANSQYGVLISGAATQLNVLEATCTVHGLPCAGILTPNVISGNGLGGVRLQSGAPLNSIFESIIGLNAAHTAAVPNGGPGVDIDNAPGTQVGRITRWGTWNYIAGNLGPGVRFTNTDGGLVGYFNQIGTAKLGNGGPGVELINTTNTAVKAVLVVNNAGAGIAVEGATSTGNLIAPFSVGGNSGLPIDLGNDGPTPNGAHSPPGPDNWLPYPVVTAYSGSVITGTACLNCTVLIYFTGGGNQDAPGGGGVQWQSTNADATGHWSATLTGGLTRLAVTVQACTAPCPYQWENPVPSHSDTSELSPLFVLWVPAVRR